MTGKLGTAPSRAELHAHAGLVCPDVVSVESCRGVVRPSNAQARGGGGGERRAEENLPVWRPPLRALHGNLGLQSLSVPRSPSIADCPLRPFAREE